jgi:UDP-N-acetylglucosamine--N-acetylmuramyl-(pentapeptide) pyrophosphoryl-undecaprenol N-acetylglucosamine transferase
VLNETVPKALSGRDNLQIRHQTGAVMQADVAANYQTLGVNAEVIAFIEDMAAAYQWADLIICRAGAMTVSEVAASGLPAIFVPLQNAIDDHQTANARYLSDAGAALLLPQLKLNADNLAEIFQQGVTALASMGQAAKSLARLDATRTVADICSAEATS